MGGARLALASWSLAHISSLSLTLSSWRRRKTTAGWEHSKAKALLARDIANGEVTPEMLPMQVYHMREEYWKWKYENFAKNYRILQAKFVVENARMEADCLAYEHDLLILKDLRAGGPPTPVPWHKSEASKLLKQDIDEKKHLQMKPQELYATRDAYRAFSLKVFRDHIYQEIDHREKASFRFAKKKKRALFTKASLMESVEDEW